MERETDARDRVAISNERARLLANALDRASTACVTVGIFGPISATLYGPGAVAPAEHSAFYAASATIWPCAAVFLHVMARQALGTLT